MRNVLGVLLAAVGAGLVFFAIFGRDAGTIAAGVVLFAGAVALLIDWDGK